MGTTPSGDPPDGADAATAAAIAAAAMGVVLTIGAVALFGAHAALSVGVGAVIAVLNLVTMRAIVGALLRPPEGDERADADSEAQTRTHKDHVAEGKRGGAAWGAFAVVKILVLFGGIWILLTRGLVDPIPLVVGYGVLPIGIATSSLFAGLAPRRGRKK